MKLRLYLIDHDMTCDAFARSIGTSSEAVRRYAAGQRVPRPAVMQKIIEATKGAVGPGDFYGLTVDSDQAA